MADFVIQSLHAPVAESPRRWAPGVVAQVHRRSVTVRLQPALRVAPELLTLAVPALGDGPLGILVAGAWPPPDLAADAAVTPTVAGWAVGGHLLTQGEALRWQPSPSPQTAPAQWGAMAQQLDAALRRGPAGMLDSPPAHGSAFGAAVDARLHAGVTAVVAALRAGDGSALAAAARGLLGVGQGLTPAGDDLLTGLLTMLQRAGHPLAGALTPLAVDAHAATTPVAAHMLRWAAQGVVNAHLLALADAAVAGDVGAVQTALPRALAHGATSGADFARGVQLGLATLAARTS